MIWNTIVLFLQMHTSTMAFLLIVPLVTSGSTYKD